MEKTTVIHHRDAPVGWTQDEKYVYGGRPGRWGNPFVMHDPSDEERTRVIQAYTKWITTQPFLLGLIARGDLDGKILVCWCKPKPCHCDLLAQLANETMEERV